MACPLPLVMLPIPSVPFPSQIPPSNFLYHFSQDGNTALILASRKGQHEVVEVLLTYGADKEAKNDVSE